MSQKNDLLTAFALGAATRDPYGRLMAAHREAMSVFDAEDEARRMDRVVLTLWGEIERLVGSQEGLGVDPLHVELGEIVLRASNDVLEFATWWQAHDRRFTVDPEGARTVQAALRAAFADGAKWLQEPSIEAALERCKRVG